MIMYHDLPLASTSPLQPADILEQAADLIETVGHAKDVPVQYGFEGEVLGFCITGAIAHVGKHQQSNLEGKILSALHSRLRTFFYWETVIMDPVVMSMHGVSMHGPRSHASWIMEWNDHECTTKEEAVDLLKNTAKDIRNTETAS